MLHVSYMYLPTFGLNLCVNVGEYSIYGSYGMYTLPYKFLEATPLTCLKYYKSFLTRPNPLTKKYAPQKTLSPGCSSLSSQNPGRQLKSCGVAGVMGTFTISTATSAVASTNAGKSTVDR